MQLGQELNALEVDAEIVILHAAGPEWSYRLQAAIDGSGFPLLQEVGQGEIEHAFSAQRGDMFLYDRNGVLQHYLLARRPDLDFNDPDGYAWMLDQVVTLSSVL